MKTSLRASDANEITKQVAESGIFDFYVVSDNEGAKLAILQECIKPAVLKGEFYAPIPYPSPTLNDIRRHGYFVVGSGSSSVARWDDESLTEAYFHNKANGISG